MHDHGHKCHGCLMSRRCFMQRSAAAVAAMAAVGGAAKASAAADGLGEYVDLAGLRPCPEVRVLGATLRPAPPYWLGWPGTAYDVEQKRQEYETAFADSAKRVGIGLAHEADPLESDEAVAGFIKKLQAEQPDAAIVLLQHLQEWGHVQSIAGAGVPLIVFSPIGTSFTQHVKNISRREGVYVISSLETAALDQALRMIRAKAQLAAARLLIVAGDQRNETVMERIGTNIRHLPRATMEELFAAMPENDETHEVAKALKAEAQGIVEPTEDDLLNAARAFQAAKHLVKQEDAHGLTSDCLGMVMQRKAPTPPCMAASLFQDAGVTYGCEGDLNAALSLMLTSFLFDKPGFMNDPVPETVKNRLIAAHCTSGRRLNGFDAEPEPMILRSHSESDLGVSTQILWREGQPVTLLLFQGPNKIIVDTGTVMGNVDTPPAGGCRTSFEIAMDDIEDCRDVLGFHQVVFYGNHKRDVESFCQIYGIEVVHSPRYAEEGPAHVEA